MPPRQPTANKRLAIQGVEDNSSKTPRSPDASKNILEAALRLFTLHGFTATSTDQLAQEASVSKSTVYKLFPTKDDLLVAAVIYGCHERNVTIDIDELRDMPLRPALELVARRFIESFMAPKGIRLMQLVITESRRHPVIGARFLEAGPLTVQRSLTKLLEKPAKEGLLHINDASLAAQNFISLLGGITQMTLLVNERKAITPKERDAQARLIATSILRGE